MNNIRRKKIEKIIAKLEDLQAQIEEIKDEEQDAFDNLPDSIQGSERGCDMEFNISQLDEAFEYIYQVVEALEEAVN